ncbi:MAG: transglutaminase-like domain-containing protein [Candidatus Acidiferrum sp.]
MNSTRSSMLGALAALAAFAMLAAFGWGKSAAENPPPRTVEFTYRVHFPAMPGAAEAVHLWIPTPPRMTPMQDPVSGLHIESVVRGSWNSEPRYHNGFYQFEPTAEQLASGFDVTERFTVTRREFRVLRGGQALEVSAPPPAHADSLGRDLEPDKLVPINGVIAQLAEDQTAGARTPIEKARRIYDYVVTTMHYDKSGEGWGRGDAIWACDSKRGNCTDFHSLLIAMMRSAGIPARFEIGFPLPEGKTEGDIPGYHCWAEFFIDGIGWIPVDASEASKNPAKKDYFFGTLDANRVQFTEGRDLHLSAEQQGPPLNYFIYPYGEVAGQAVKGLESHFSFREVPGAAQMAAGR